MSITVCYYCYCYCYCYYYCYYCCLFNLIIVPFTFNTEWLEDTGHLIVSWQLSSGSNYYIDGIIAEIDINGVWIDVISDTKINMEAFNVYQVRKTCCCYN